MKKIKAKNTEQKSIEKNTMPSSSLMRVIEKINTDREKEMLDAIFVSLLFKHLQTHSRDSNNSH